MIARRVRLPLAMLPMVAMLLGACGNGDDGNESEASDGVLAGLFTITEGTCGPSRVAGSSFRMVQSGGTIKDGPYVPNGDSPCADKTWTPLAPGRDGGLRTGDYQPQPASPFDPAGNATSDRITKPQRWFAVAFGLATNERDPQTNNTADPPRITVDGMTLSGDLASFAASWNGQFFNQGAPKPGGERPGTTTGPTGTYDPTTHKYTLDWASQIVGGPFNNFTGVWHLEGTFEPD